MFAIATTRDRRQSGTGANGPRAKFLALALTTAAFLAAADPRFAAAVRNPFSPMPMMTIYADTQSGVDLTGKVTFEGTPKKLKPLNMSAEPGCARLYDAPPLPENALNGPGNAMPNVIVYISEGAPDDRSTEPIVQLAQRGCRYAPHIVMAQTDQEVWVRNDDSVTHSVHPMAHHNAEWNRSQPPGTPPVVIRYTQPEFISVKCELHPWMRGVLAVFKNSHHAVTDENGFFTLPNLPPGKYTLTAWHETYGTQSKQITVAAGQPTPVNFVFKVTPY